MKKIVFTTVFSVITMLTFAQATPEDEAKQVKWYAIDEVLEQVAQAPKKILIDVYTDWCGWCKVMDRNTFSDPKIAAYMNKHFYSVKLNAEQRAPIVFGDRTWNYMNEQRVHELAAALLQGKMGYPSIVYMDEKGQLLSVVASYMQPDALLPVLVFFAENYYTQMPWEDYLNKAWPAWQKEN